jgi:uncharacterized membrane protein YdbT with pleckstrin-like domain
MANQEHLRYTPEHEPNPELERISAERRGELHERLKEKAEESRENLDEARKEALERAHTHEKETIQQEKESHSPVERRRGPISKKEREASFNATMKEVQTQMSAPSRLFSKVIHNKVIEKTSEAVGSTVARPNAVLSGAIFAFILTFGIYLVAKNLGYPLSGFETIGAFVLGWALGIVYDFVKVMVTGRKS